MSSFAKLGIADSLATKERRDHKDLKGKADFSSVLFCVLCVLLRLNPPSFAKVRMTGFDFTDIAVSVSDETPKIRNPEEPLISAGRRGLFTWS
jgi:hypothetical protein